ncbi:MAG: hypothetical protein ABRQ25_05745 [Clostridiaceae bacterium]
MKKYLIISITGILLILIIAFSYIYKKNALPKTPPDISVVYNQDKIEAVKGFYNWFDAKEGGNSSLPDIPENLVKNLKDESVKKGESISFSFDTTLKQPGKVTVNLVVPNLSSREKFGLSGQKCNGSSFIVPNEIGEQIFIITAFWDETHTVDYVFKVTI